MSGNKLTLLGALFLLSFLSRREFYSSKPTLKLSMRPCISQQAIPILRKKTFVSSRKIRPSLRNC